MEDLKLPAELKEINNHTKSLINEFPNMNPLKKYKMEGKSRSHLGVHPDLMESFSTNFGGAQNDHQMMSLIENNSV